MNPIRTKPIKGLVIFLVIAFLLSTGMIVLFAIRSEEVMVMRVLVFIMCGIFAIGSLVVLFNQLFDYVEVRDDLIIHHILFIKKKA